MNNVTLNKMDLFASKKELSDINVEINLGDEKINIVIKPFLFFDDEQNFIERVANCVVTEEDYRPGLFDTIFFASVVQMMTNINIPKIKSKIDGEDSQVLDLNRMHNWMVKTDFPNAWIDETTDGDDSWVYIEYLREMCVKKVDFLLSKLESPLNGIMEKLGGLMTFIKSLDSKEAKELFDVLPKNEEEEIDDSFDVKDIII